MKVFVYGKISSNKIAKIERVESVRHSENLITFKTKDGDTFTFNTREVKTTTYQN